MEKAFESLRDTALIIIGGFTGGIASQYVGESLPSQFGALIGLFIVVLPSVYIVNWAIAAFSAQQEDE